MQDDFNKSKLPSFSNEPQQFGNMTLFMHNGELVLHIATHACGVLRRGQFVKEIAEYYLSYEEKQTESFMSFAEMQLKHIERCSDRIGKPIIVPDEKRNETLRKMALNAAARWADNCEDGHDLSAQFCSIAKQLGLALQDRLESGIETMTVYESHSSGLEAVKNLRLTA